MSKIIKEEPPTYQESLRFGNKEKLLKIKQQKTEDFNTTIIEKFYEKFEKHVLIIIDKIVNVIHQYNRIPDRNMTIINNFHHIIGIDGLHPNKKKYMNILCNEFNRKKLSDFEVIPRGDCFLIE